MDFPADIEIDASASLGLIYGTIGGNILELQLTALQKEGKLNILSRPSITTLDNQSAYTETGQRVPYVTISADGEQEVQFEDAVLRLEITPHVIDEMHLKMRVLIKKDEVDFTNDVEGNPFIFKKQTETNLILRNGATIVISGLTKTTQSRSKRGVPWLMDVPGLGWLFKAQGKGEQMEEVLIFITPHVLGPYEEVSQGPGKPAACRAFPEGAGANRRSVTRRHVAPRGIWMAGQCPGTEKRCRGCRRAGRRGGCHWGASPSGGHQPRMG
ncbi:hypothetical protein ACFL0Q_08965 [Thermodesulfobacteriota bacterium]